MIISKCIDEKHIYTAWRENGERQFKLEAFEPYFFIEDDEFQEEKYTINKYINRSFKYEKGDWLSLKGKPLKKVIVEQATDIYKARKMWNTTYEADVPFGFRYAIDELNQLPEYEMRKWYWDMEWQQGGEHHNKITVIVAYDSFDKNYYQWAWFPNYDGDNELFYNNEKDMIESFIQYMIDKDPDMLIAWFGLKFDLPKLLDRCCALGINPMRMSPINRIEGVKKTATGYSFSKGESGFSPIQQPLGGRITLNLDLAFERQWNDSQRGTLPSMSLEYVSQTLFGEGKSKETIFDDPNEFYRRGWLEDTEAYLKYARIDVELLVRIDETNFCSEAVIALQRLLVAPFEACFYASHMGSIYFMRNADWICKTGSKVDKREEYEGAMIYDPLSENTNGLHLNVAAFDFAGLYPAMIISRNISWESKSETPTELGVNIATPRDFSPTVREHMLYYNTDKLGLLPRAVLELKDLRNEYKGLMREAKEEGSEAEHNKWYNNQMAVKRLMASFYGIVAYQGFGWADVNLAASITASAREAIRLAAFKAKEIEG